MRLILKIVVAVALAVIPAAFAVNLASSDSISDKPAPDIRRDATVNAVEAVMPSVVNIATAKVVEYHDFYDPIFQQYYGPVRQRAELSGVGSGVIVDEDGYVLTCLHVVRRAELAQVKLADGRVFEVEPQYVASPGSDIALLKLKTKPGEKFKAVRFAPDDDLLLGETVVALGNPFGLGGSVSRGILSSKNRRMAVEDEPLKTQDWLQTDAAINPGNSGGPLINLRGELIGVDNAMGKGQGIGFAIPARQIVTALSEILAPESTDGVWFGARVRSENDGWLHVSFVQPGSPSDKAGMKVGQRILQVNGKTPSSMIQFNRALAAGKNREAEIQVVEGISRRALKVQFVSFDDLIKQKLGLTLLKLNPEMAANFRLNAGQGLFIEQVAKDGPAERAELQRGFVLTAIDGKNTGDPLQVADVLSTKSAGENAALTVVVPQRISNGFVRLDQVTINVVVR